MCVSTVEDVRFGLGQVAKVWSRYPGCFFFHEACYDVLVSTVLNWASRIEGHNAFITTPCLLVCIGINLAPQDKLGWQADYRDEQQEKNVKVERHKEL